MWFRVYNTQPTSKWFQFGVVQLPKSRFLRSEIVSAGRDLVIRTAEEQDQGLTQREAKAWRPGCLGMWDTLARRWQGERIIIGMGVEI